MNPRHFCRERSYHHALLLSYSFDPTFFEKVILPDLWTGRSGDILVIADGAQVDDALQSATGNLWHLGKRYLLARTNHLGAFHPKIFLRLGSKEGVVMLGSGNLTSAGWGGNRELATSWKVGPEHVDNGKWLSPLLDEAASWCGTELERDAIARMRSLPWVTDGTNDAMESASIMYSRRGATLANTLAARWAGRRFNQVLIVTGSTDEAGAFLRWAHSTFGITKATVALTPARASFDPAQLSEIPIEIRICEAPPDRTMHAKFYWFDGADGAGAIMGSANCSAAAWLLPVEQGGNIESVVVYDRPTRIEFDPILRLFDSPAHLPEDVLMRRPPRVAEMKAQVQRYRLAEIRWYTTTRSIRALVLPALAEDCTLWLTLGETSFQMERSHRRDGWMEYQLAEGIGTGTAFATATISDGTQQWVTAPRWINDVQALDDASLASRLTQPFHALEYPAGFTEQARTLSDLQEIARTLFSGAEMVHDVGPSGGTGSRGEKQGIDDVTPVNPLDLVCNLDDDRSMRLSFSPANASGLSLGGIVRMLFDIDTEECKIGATNDEGKLRSFAGELDPGDVQKEPEDDPTPKRAPAKIAAQHRELLAAQMSGFLLKLSSKSFSTTCTVSRMVQAVAFPLAVAVKGKAGGWVSPRTAAQWTQAVFAILLRGKGSGAPCLLRRVERRYVEEGRKDIFDTAVGEGTLWAVLIAALASIEWEGIGAYLDKALALREVFSTTQLVATADPQNIASLVGKMRIENARAHIGALAPRVVELLSSIERLLAETWKADLQAQGQGVSCNAGDLLWRTGVGWGICLVNSPPKSPTIKVRLRGNETSVQSGWYVNVSYLARDRASLAESLCALRELCDASSLMAV